MVHLAKASAVAFLMALAGAAADGQERESLPALKEAFLAAGEKTTAVRFSPDGKTLALGGPAAVRILSSDTFRESRRLLQQGLVDELLFEPEGKILFSRSRDEDTVLWETEGWTRPKFAMETGLPGIDPRSIRPPEPKEWVPLPDRMKGFRLWNVTGLWDKRRWAARAQVGDCLGLLLDRVTALAAVDAGLLLGDEEGYLLKLPWETISLAGPDLRQHAPGDPAPKLRSCAAARHFRPHAGEISSIGVSPDRRFCVTAGRDGKVNLWAFDKLPTPGGPPPSPKALEPLWSLAGYVAEMSPNGAAVAIADRAGVTVYEVATGKPVSFNPTTRSGGRVVRLRFSPGGGLLAAVVCRCGDCASGEAMVTYRKTLLEHGGGLVIWK